MAMPELKARVEVAIPPGASCTVVRVGDTFSPRGEEDTDRVTGPAKLFVLVSVIVALAEAPAWIVRLEGFPLILKLPTWTITIVIVTLCMVEPPDPITVTEYCPGVVAPVAFTISEEVDEVPAASRTLV